MNEVLGSSQPDRSRGSEIVIDLTSPKSPDFVAKLESLFPGDIPSQTANSLLVMAIAADDWGRYQTVRIEESKKNVAGGPLQAAAGDILDATVRYERRRLLGLTSGDSPLRGLVRVLLSDEEQWLLKIAAINKASQAAQAKRRIMKDNDYVLSAEARKAIKQQNEAWATGAIQWYEQHMEPIHEAHWGRREFPADRVRLLGDICLNFRTTPSLRRHAKRNKDNLSRWIVTHHVEQYLVAEQMQS